MLGFQNTVTKPNEALPTKELVKEYGSIRDFYIALGRYYAQFFNFSGLGEWNNATVTDRNNQSNTAFIGSEFDEILENEQLLQGIQNIREYAYLLKDFNNQKFNEPFVPGKQLSRVLMHVEGNFLKVMIAAKVSIRLNTPMANSVISQRMKIYSMLKAFKPIVDDITKNANVQIMPDEQMLTGSTDSREEELRESVYKSEFGKVHGIMQQILDNIIERSNLVNVGLRAFRGAYSGRAAIIKINPKTGYLETVNPKYYKSIAAQGNDDDYGAYDIARMTYTYITREDLLANYSSILSTKEINEIKNQESSYDLTFNSIGLAGYNSGLMGYDAAAGIYIMVTIYCQSIIDSKYRVSINEEGEKVAKYIGDRKTKNREWLPVLRKLTIVGGKYVIDYGIEESVFDYINPKRIEFPIRHFRPYVINNQNRCFVDMLKSTQKQIDAVEHQIQHLWSVNLGAFAVFNGKKYRSTDVGDLVSDIKRYGAIVSEDTGDDGNIADREPMVETVIASLASEINTLIGLSKVYEARIKDIINVSDMVMGTPREYVSRSTQQQSMAASTSNVLYYFHGTMQLIADSLQYALNLRIKKIIKNPDEEDKIILGEDNIRYLKEFFKSGINMQDIQAFVKLDDVVDDEKRATMKEMALAALNAKEVTFLDALKTINFKTTTELEDYLTSAFDKRKQEAEANAARQAIMQQMQQDQQSADKRAVAETQTMGRVDAAQAQAEAGIAKAAISNAGVQVDPQQAAMQE